MAAIEAELRRRVRTELTEARSHADGVLDDASLAAIIAHAVATALGWHLEAPEHTRNATLSSRRWKPAGGPRGGRPPEIEERTFEEREFRPRRGPPFADRDFEPRRGRSFDDGEPGRPPFDDRPFQPRRGSPGRPPFDPRSGGRPSGGRPSGGRPSGGRPSGGRPSGGRPSGGRGGGFSPGPRRPPRSRQ